MKKDLLLSGKEVSFPDNELIVSKTDTKGKIYYTNRLFLDIAGYTEAEVVGQPHNVIRHPDMPRSIFKLLWDTISSGQEIFAYVVNRCKNGDHYWVYAHVTPSFGPSGEIISYHSNRRVPQKDIIQEQIIPLYKQLKEVEDKAGDRKQGLSDAEAMIVDMLAEKNMKYDEFVLTIGQSHRRGYR